jgi:hypothetical protein
MLHVVDEGVEDGRLEIYSTLPHRQEESVTDELDKDGTTEIDFTQ